MASRGASSPRRKGDVFVAEVVSDQQSLGRLAYRVRCLTKWQHDCQGAGVAVIAVEPCRDTSCTVNGPKVTHTFLIQAKVTGKVSAAERAALISEADAVGGIPLLAWPDGTGVRYEQLGGTA